MLDLLLLLMVSLDETSETRELKEPCKSLDKDLKRFNEPVTLRLLLVSKSSAVGDVRCSDVKAGVLESSGCALNSEGESTRGR